MLNVLGGVRITSHLFATVRNQSVIDVPLKRCASFVGLGQSNTETMKLFVLSAFSQSFQISLQISTRNKADRSTNEQ